MKMKDPYEVLGLTADADPDQLRARYEALRARYGEQRYQDGELGNEGARLLSELEANWKMIEKDIARRESSKKYGGGWGEIDSLIRAGSYDEAQDVLDSITDRDAKWHYYQSIIFYKREWLSESRSQLMIAIQLDPNNAKYRESLNKLDMVMGNPNAGANDVGAGQGPYVYEDGAYDERYRQQQQYQQQQSMNDAANTCANCMLCYCMSEMCCSCARICG